MNKKALIAMSGGVDSSVAAFLMKEQGYDCMGATMKLYANEEEESAGGNTCCSLADVEDARDVAFTLGIPYHVFNFTEDFRKHVIERFIQAYEHGQTPNPCIDCNRYLKFERFYRRAQELQYDYVVTGHYARILQEPETGRYRLYKSLDSSKDQSYVLYDMTQEQLAHTQFPLGTLLKTEVREIARKQHLINAKKHDSQDICFVQNGSYADFIRQYTGKSYPEGDFIDLEGHILGRHKGIIHYTIGQRKGLGLSLPHPMYVVSVDPATNSVVLGANKDLFSRSLTAHHLNLIGVNTISRPTKYYAKIRYSQTEQPALVEQIDSDTLHIEFESPQRAITRGQAVVLYDGDEVIGGGTIA